MIDLSKTKCLVTGGAGFIGSHVVDKLIAAGSSVRVLDNLVNGNKVNFQHHIGNPQFEFIHGSIVDPFDVERAMADVDIVFHLACLGVRHSLTHPFENHRVNSEGTLLLLDSAYRHGIKKFIHCSSSEVYGTAQTVPMAEAHPTHPCTVYGAGKLAGEAYSRAYFLTYKLPTVIIRPFNTYGPRSHYEGDAGEMIPKSIIRLLSDEDILIFGTGAQTRDFTYVEDTADGLIAACLCDDILGKTLNLGSNFEISILELAKRLKALFPNSKSELKILPDRPGDVDRLFADPSRFNSLTSWQPQFDFDQGLAKTISSFKELYQRNNTLLQEEAGINWVTA